MRDVVTAGVILEYEARYVFQTGLNRARDALGVVRLGGHVEPGESAVECARREVREEGNTDASILAADMTWSYEPNGESFDLKPFGGETSHPAPVFVATMAPDFGLSVTYLAAPSNRPTPGAETQALLFLTLEDVNRLTTEVTTLGAFVEGGGLLDEVTALPKHLPLRPHGQLRALAELLRTGDLHAQNATEVDGA